VTQVQTRCGLVSGVMLGDLQVFRGIPFAKPPVGDLRWRPPQPVPAWSGVREATDWGHIAMQPPPQDPNAIGSTTPSEDCLTLNIWSPSRAKALPVMVWIHGGGFTTGSGIAAQSDGGYLARQGVVVVTINYRLGRFGFFAHPALSAEVLSAEDGGGGVANYGLMDQIAALTWVRDNIGGFGGDADNVTIFGGSAGGDSVVALMTSPKARGLFHRAIAQSPPARDRSKTLAEAEADGVRLANEWGGGDSVEALRALPADVVLGADATSPALSGDMPIIDGEILTDQLISTFERGEQAQTPLIIGATDYELPPLIVPPVLQARVAPYADAGPVLQHLYKSPAEYEHYLSDAIFAEPAAHIAQLHARRQPTFRYRFSLFPQSLAAMFTGAFHSMEGSYVFGTVAALPWPVTDQDHRLAATVSAYWTTFAKTGSPDHAGVPAWPEASDGMVLDFARDGPRAIGDDRREILNGLRRAFAHGDLPLVIGADAAG
jgi:para-nitrobenzyl esterase